MSATRVLVLGIDGASPDLIAAWAADGTLPNFAALLARGRSATTRGIDGFFIGSTWPSIYTGATPARHGFHYQVQLRPGSYDFWQPAEHGLFEGVPFWRALSDAGRKVAILDAPLSPLEPTLNGMQILEWGGHDAIYGFGTHPASLGQQIETRFGMHPAGTTCDRARRGAEDYQSFVDALSAGVGTKSQMTRHFLGEGDWDLFMQVFSEAHCVGHQCWHLHDVEHPAHDPSIRAHIGDPLKHIYQRIDAAIGEIVEAAGNCTTFVFSSHGMSYWYGAQFLLPEILFRLEATARPQSAARAESESSLAISAGSWAWHRLPMPLRRGLRGLRQRFGPRTNAPARPRLEADTLRSRCFHHRHGLALGGIRLNLAGREPNGQLSPGQEADAFCDALTRDLMDIIDERTGKPLIRRVLRVADLYSGPRLADLPDLIVDYSDAIPTGSSMIGDGAGATVRVSSPKIGVLEGTNAFGRTGEHRPQGLLIATGPGIGQGALDRPISVLDLAPTWTALLDVDLPESDGQAIAELLVRD